MSRRRPRRSGLLSVMTCGVPLKRRDYRRAVAGCTHWIEEFWTAMTGVGFCPEGVALVPRNDLDERYAYFLLSKPR